MAAVWNVATIGTAGKAGQVFVSVLPFALLGVLAIGVVHLLLALAHRGSPEPRARWGWWAGLLYLGLLASVSVLAVTSLVGVVRFGILDGWGLFVHMCASGLFTFVLPLVALTWCRANRCARSVCSDEAGGETRFSGLAKFTFWIILAAGLVTAGTMLLSMLPLCDTQGLEVLLNVHRYAGLAVVGAMVLHLYATVLQRCGVR